MLDIEVVAGVCPKATIVVYFAAFTEQGWISILDAATQDKTNNPGVISRAGVTQKTITFGPSRP